MVPANTIVSGDQLVLEAGDVAAADARLHTAHALTTNEAPLTGESTPVEKTTVATAPDTPLADRHGQPAIVQPCRDRFGVADGLA